MHALTPDRSDIAAITCIAALVVPGFAVGQAPTEWDGLVQRRSSAVDLLYVRPGASLSGYKSVRLERLQVAFAKDWKPNDTRTMSQRLTNTDFENIKNGLADQFAKTFTEELTSGGYKIVTEAGDDVLDVTPLIVDLYIAAPDKPSAGRSRTYTADPGRMTLVLELRDSDTGQILARALDAEAPSYGSFQVASSVSNMAAADRAIAKRGSQLVDALDEANKTLK